LQALYFVEPHGIIRDDRVGEALEEFVRLHGCTSRGGAIGLVSRGSATRRESTRPRALPETVRDRCRR
jgi:non-canonical (house-cleaning) NTP pyrophosphatase